MEHNLNTKINTFGYMEIWCEKGHHITSWNEGDDILDFSSFTIAYTSPDTDISIYHCISDEENERLELLRKESEESEPVSMN